MDLIKLALFGGAAYFLYSKYGPSAALPVSSLPAADSTAYIPKTVTQLLDSAAKNSADYLRSGGRLQADKWKYIWTHSLNKPPIEDSVFDALFFPDGRPTSEADNPKMLAGQFVSKVATAGLSGFAAAMNLPAPNRLAQMRRRSYR